MIGNGKRSQNMSFVYTKLLKPRKKQEFFSIQYLNEFLLNERLFDSWVEKNKVFLDYLEWSKQPFTLETMLNYIDHKGPQKQYISPATVANRKYQMLRICRELIALHPEKWTKLDQYKLEDFFRRIKPGSRQSNMIAPDKILNREEIELLLEKAPHNWKLILLFLATTGVRVSELISIIRQRCVIIKDGVEITVIGKRNKQRTIPCDIALYEDICITFPSRYYLFSTTNGTPFSRKHIYRGCQRLGQQYLMKSIGVHTFRHSFATHMLKNGHDIKSVAELLGHSSTRPTELYLHLPRLEAKDIIKFKHSIRGTK